jgi:hypothetical protein
MATIVNATATIENLNMTGAFDTDNTALDSAIPYDTIGTYQLINKCISELVSIKNTIKTNEKNLSKDISIDPALANDDTTVTLTNSVGAATHHSNFTNHETRNRLVAAAKPAIYQVKATTHLYSEDCMFSILSGICFELFKVTNSVNGVHQGGSASYAGLSTIPTTVPVTTV